LSYTTFEYSNLRAPDDVLAGQPIHVSLEVTNTGTMPGRETVQLYVGDEVTQDVVRPVKELKGFHKVELAPGESQIVRFTLNTHDLAYYDVHRERGSRRRQVPAARRQLCARHPRDAPFNWIAPVDDRAPIEHSTFEDDSDGKPIVGNRHQQAGLQSTRASRRADRIPCRASSATASAISAFNFYWFSLQLFLTYYYTDVLGLRGEVAGMIIFLCLTWDGSSIRPSACSRIARARAGASIGRSPVRQHPLAASFALMFAPTGLEGRR
jgi:hypothetical protein